MFRLLASLPMSRYRRRTYIISSGDAHSATLAKVFESKMSPTNDQFHIVDIPRARRVHQPLLTSPLTSLRCLIVCLSSIARLDAEIVLLNGPGSCVPFCFAVFLFRVRRRQGGIFRSPLSSLYHHIL
jgi:beta-1,4-N-acetylglucosaminyltransferase